MGLRDEVGIDDGDDYDGDGQTDCTGRKMTRRHEADCLAKLDGDD